MKSVIILLLLLLPLNLTLSQELKPYILAFESTDESMVELKNLLLDQLAMNDIKVVGQYQPAGQDSRYVLVFTSKELMSAVQQVGGLSGFAATLRIGITQENGKTVVSYTNPAYWGNAYFREDFEKVSDQYSKLTAKLEKAMSAAGIFNGAAFGSEKGLSGKKLQGFHYMFGMPYFDDTIELNAFDDHTQAVSKIEASLKQGVPDVKMVYKVEIPGQNLCLYGFALSGTDGEGKFLPIIDITEPKHTAFLPYEVLVKDGEVHMLNGRFRIALSFPDLTMGTFTKIMSTPGDIENLLEKLVE